MISKEWLAEFRGHRIAVANAWSIGVQMLGPLPWPKTSGYAKLYIDGECVDTNTEWVANSRRPLLRGRITHGDQVHVVEVFMTSWALTGVQAKIVVDGQLIQARVR